MAPRDPCGRADDQQRHGQEQWKRGRRNGIPPERAQRPIGEEEDDLIPATGTAIHAMRHGIAAKTARLATCTRQIRGMGGGEQVDQLRRQKIQPPGRLRITQAHSCHAPCSALSAVEKSI